MDYEVKINKFHDYVNHYIIVLFKLIDFSKENNLIPFKILLMLPYIKNYLENNKVEIIQSSVKYILEYKNEILNFSSEKYDDLDEENDDNVSRKECIKNIKNIKKKVGFDDSEIKSNFFEDDILNFIIVLKNNYKNLDSDSIYLFKGYLK